VGKTQKNLQFSVQKWKIKTSIHLPYTKVRVCRVQ
jgi:hypothetical protein